MAASAACVCGLYGCVGYTGATPPSSADVCQREPRRAAPLGKGSNLDGSGAGGASMARGAGKITCQEMYDSTTPIF